MPISPSTSLKPTIVTVKTHGSRQIATIRAEVTANIQYSLGGIRGIRGIRGSAKLILFGIGRMVESEEIGMAKCNASKPYPAAQTG